VSGVAMAHVGVTEFIPSVPDPSAMTMDGSEDDWGWFDRDFAVTPDEVEGWLGAYDDAGPGAWDEDYSLSYFMAWSLPPENNLYFFSRVIDDTLKSTWAENKRNWWDDDTTMIGIDADHSGGSILVNAELDEAHNGFRIVVNALASSEYYLDIGGAPGTDVAPNGDWGGEPPYSDYGSVLLPAGSDHGSANVEYTHEFKHTVWASYDVEGPDGAFNVPYQFEADGVAHFTPRFNDVDHLEGGEGGGGDMFGYIGGSHDGQADGDLGVDVITLLTHDPDDFPQSTAVEHSTWARIKQHHVMELK